MITPTTKEKILSIVSVFETSNLKPRYDMLVVLHDGPGHTPQITYGKHQTTEHSNLKALLELYVAQPRAMYANEVRPYVSLIGKVPLHGSSVFKQLLKVAGRDVIMERCQDVFFEKYYWNPAVKFFYKEEFSLPLSMLVVYDSFIHSGGIPVWLRNRFKAATPANGGDEKTWIIEYVNTRDYWLQHHSKKILQGTDYRTDCFIECILNNNWYLADPVVCKFNSDNKKSWITIA